MYTEEKETLSEVILIIECNTVSKAEKEARKKLIMILKIETESFFSFAMKRSEAMGFYFCSLAIFMCACTATKKLGDSE